MKFKPSKSCDGCVFTDNIALLDEWYHHGINQFDKFKERITHEEFV